jgi:CotH kinase protein
LLFASSTFSLMNSGNRTLRAPKRSWKVNFEIADGTDRLAGMERLNLKSMFNDASQMRESIAGRLFEKVGVPASRLTYAKLGINATYMGLFSLVEQVDPGEPSGHRIQSRFDGGAGRAGGRPRALGPDLARGLPGISQPV